MLIFKLINQTNRSSVIASLIEYDRRPFGNRTFDFVRSTKIYCEFDYVRLPKPFERLVIDWVRLLKPFDSEIRQGYLYFGDIGEDEATKLKIALMKYNAGAIGTGGFTVVFQYAVGALRTKAVIIVVYCASLNREKAKLNGKTQICKFCGSVPRVSK